MQFVYKVATFAKKVIVPSPSIYLKTVELSNIKIYFRPNLFSSSLPGLSSEVLCPYSKQFVHSKSSQYKKMKLEWRNNVYLARSKIQGLGLYAARDLERHTMVIEYIGEIIRHELSESREKQYEARVSKIFNSVFREPFFHFRHNR